MMRRFLPIAAVYVAVMVVAALVVNASAPASPGRSSVPIDPGDGRDNGIVLAAALQPFDDCDGLLEYFREAALERVGPYGLGGGMVVVDDLMLQSGRGGAAGAGVEGDLARAAAGNPAASAEAKTDDFSGTNVQEAGVDEPDIVKTDGRRIIVLSGRRLHVLINDEDGLRRAGSVRLPNDGGQEMLLDGDRVLVLGRQYSEVPLIAESRVAMPHMGASTTALVLVDIGDPTAPAVTSTMELDGDYLSARLVDGVARVVTRSQPTALPFVTPEGGGLRSEREAERRNREVIRTSTIDQWLPFSVTTDARTQTEDEQSLLACEAVHHPRTFAGFGLVSVLSVDLGTTLAARGTTAVVGDSDTVYATQENLYVALNRWGSQPWDTGREIRPEAAKTELHQFDISDPAAAAYVASGAVRGRLLNQWALSEHDGHLRVATTRDGLGRPGRSDSSVIVLEQRGEQLSQIGRVDGLGKGEQIYAVRYAGDIAYVVTFRQTDPLYTVDLSDPQRPRVRGELKIKGYSSYLHPIDDDTLVGVGQDATNRGQVTGAQVSLFDVSDLAAPKRVDQADLDADSTAVEYDHRAFLYWPATKSLVLPVESWEKSPFMGVEVLTVDGRRLQSVGRVSHTKKGDDGFNDDFYGDGIRRSLVIGDELFTVSEGHVMAHDLQSLAPRGAVALRSGRR